AHGRDHDHAGIAVGAIRGEPLGDRPDVLGRREARAAELGHDDLSVTDGRRHRRPELAVSPAGAAGRPAHVEPSPRAIRIRSAITAAAVAGPPAPGPLTTIRPSGGPSIWRTLVTPRALASSSSTGSDRGRTLA